MRIIPPHPGDDVNRGERYVFDALAASATAPETSGWTVLHSLDIAQHVR